MEAVNYIALAVPVFLGMILIEWLADRREGTPSFDLGDSVSNLGCGVLSQVCSIFATVVVAAAFGGLYGGLMRLAPTQLSPSSWLAWLLAFFGVDLAYYWWHRASHQVNVLWAMHIVHHQSARYNLTVALRQGSFSVAVYWVVYLPLAVLGVPFKVVLAMTSINTLYQFWIHTEKIRRLGFLEAFLNTPSHHRVHHGVNSRYIDKNYGGMLINWDKIFGTFQAEDETPVYGITSPFSSLSPGWANLHYWFELAELSRRATAWSDKLKVWLMYPGWTPMGLDKPSKSAAGAVTSPGAKRYTAVQLGAGILALGGLYRLSGPWSLMAAWGAVITATMISIGWLLDLRPWARFVEFLRVAGLAGSGLALWCLYFSPISWWLWAGAAAGAAGWAISLRARPESAAA